MGVYQCNLTHKAHFFLAILEGLALSFLEDNNLRSTIRMHKDLKRCQEGKVGEVVFPN